MIDSSPLTNWSASLEHQQDQDTIARLKAQLLHVETDASLLLSKWIATEARLRAEIRRLKGKRGEE